MSCGIDSEGCLQSLHEDVIAAFDVQEAEVEEVAHFQNNRHRVLLVVWCVLRVSMVAQVT